MHKVHLLRLIFEQYSNISFPWIKSQIIYFLFFHIKLNERVHSFRAWSMDWVESRLRSQSSNLAYGSYTCACQRTSCGWSWLGTVYTKFFVVSYKFNIAYLPWTCHHWYCTGVDAVVNARFSRSQCRIAYKYGSFFGWRLVVCLILVWNFNKSGTYIKFYALLSCLWQISAACQNIFLKFVQPTETFRASTSCSGFRQKSLFTLKSSFF